MGRNTIPKLNEWRNSELHRFRYSNGKTPIEVNSLSNGRMIIYEVAKTNGDVEVLATAFADGMEEVMAAMFRDGEMKGYKKGVEDAKRKMREAFGIVEPEK